jgi:hypothetical protein
MKYIASALELFREYSVFRPFHFAEWSKKNKFGVTKAKIIIYKYEKDIHHHVVRNIMRRCYSPE